MRSFVLLGALLWIGGVPGTTLGQVELKWNWSKNKKFYVQTTAQLKQTLLIKDPDGNPAKDREILQQMEHITTISYAVKEEKADGLTVVQTIESVLLKSADVVKPEALLRGLSLTLHLDKQGQVTKVEGYEKLIEKLKDGDSSKERTLRAALTEETLKQLATQSLGFFPDKKLKVGDDWPRQIELKLGSLGSLTLKQQFIYVGNEKLKKDEGKELAKVTFKTRKLGEYKTGNLASTVFQVTQGKLTKVEGDGVLYFDVEEGRLVQMDNQMTIEGELTLKNAGTEWKTRIKQEQTITTKVVPEVPGKTQ